MTDRELLELAAKAEGRKLKYMTQHIEGREPEEFIACWNPLIDDGDALRLATKLMMSLEVSEYEASTYAYAGKVPRVYAMELWRDDVDAATRRAIVRAAAEMGKAMTKGK